MLPLLFSGMRAYGIPCLVAVLSLISAPTQALQTEDAETAEAAVEEEREETSPYKMSLWRRAFSRPDLDPGYRLSIQMVNDIPLPGPLPDGVPRLVEDQVEINVDGGVARVDWTEDGAPQIEPVVDATPPQPPVWAEDPAGKFRARFLSSGYLVVEKRCKRCREVWRRKWKLKVPGTILTRPLLTDNRIYFGAQDNHVYSLKKKSGHRLWVTNLRNRISEPAILWDGKLDVEGEDGKPRSREVQVILLMPDDGSSLIALDARGGREMARYDLRVEDGRLLGPPLRTPDGKIVVAREKYSASEASLMVLELGSGSATAQDEQPVEPDLQPDPEASSPADTEGERSRPE